MPGLFIQKRTPTREGRIILETIWFAQKMASKENEEREHPGDKKTGVKLIYQGQEKKVIIVSTVRSSLEYVSMGSQNKLGFLFNSKRFNLGIKNGERTIYVRERTDPRLKERTRRLCGQIRSNPGRSRRVCCK